MIASCATTTAPVVTLPEKYNLGNELKEVKRAHALNASNWTQVDKQSLTFSANGNKLFLIVLDRPLEADIANKIVGIAQKKTDIYAGVDNFSMWVANNRQHYRIEKIYVLNGPEQAKEIKEKLSK